ncbi:MAG: hypothetical protein AMJ65_09650 [Phycisphaerae bacterium SG8_4]|nr:MAG: hypothetical protein AMJ65_09650 [Phycisphaerae bacterium SG8_4]
MPIYVYKCPCGNEKQVLAGFEQSDHKTVECERCGGQAQLTVQAPALKFLGPGWTHNEYLTGEELDEEGARLEEEWEIEEP